MTNQAPVCVVEGPKGKAEVYEIMVSGRTPRYEVRFNGQKEEYPSLGEAYITAGERVGTKT